MTCGWGDHCNFVCKWSFCDSEMSIMCMQNTHMNHILWHLGEKMKCNYKPMSCLWFPYKTIIVCLRFPGSCGLRWTWAHRPSRRSSPARWPGGKRPSWQTSSTRRTRDRHAAFRIGGIPALHFCTWHFFYYNLIEFLFFYFFYSRALFLYAQLYFLYIWRLGFFVCFLQSQC